MINYISKITILPYKNNNEINYSYKIFQFLHLVIIKPYNNCFKIHRKYNIYYHFFLIKTTLILVIISIRLSRSR